VVEVGVSEHDRVEGRGAGAERLGHLEVRHLALRAGLVAAVDQDARLGRREDEGGAADLATATERGDPDPFVVGHLLAVDLSADAFENVSALLAFVLQEAAHVRDGGGFDRGRPNDLGGPADFLGDLPERRAAATDHHAGLFGLDDDLAGVLVEIEVGHAGLLRNHRPDLLLGTRRRSEGARVRADRDPLPELGGEPADQIAVAGELLGVAGVHDQLRPLVFHVGDRNVVRNFLFDL